MAYNPKFVSMTTSAKCVQSNRTSTRDLNPHQIEETIIYANDANITIIYIIL